MRTAILTCFVYSFISILNLEAQSTFQTVIGGSSIFSLSPLPTLRQSFEAVNTTGSKEGSFFSPSTLTVNTQDKIIEFSNVLFFDASGSGDQKKYFLIGANGGGKVNSSLSNLVTNRNFVGGAKGGISLGYLLHFNSKLEKEKISILDIMIEKGGNLSDKELKKMIEEAIKGILITDGIGFYCSQQFEGRQLSLFNPDSSFTTQLSKTNSTLTSSTFGMNYFTSNFKNAFSLILGMSYTLKRTDNFSDLTELSLENKTISVFNNTTREASQKLTVYSGEYKNKLQSSIIAFDLYCVPRKLSNIGLHFNYSAINYKEKTISDIEDINLGCNSNCRKTI